jgi:CIC family chloride channel protein
MGTAFAGIIRTPLTSVIMIFEVTRDYTIIVPLMVSNMIAFYISQRLQPDPLYEALAKQDGLHLPTGEFRTHLRTLRVSSAIREAPEPVHPDLTLRVARSRMASGSRSSWPVADADGLLGMVRVADVDQHIRNGGGEVTVADLLRGLRERDPDESEEAGTFVHVHADQPLGQALARMGDSRHSVLPVVSRANIRTLLGVVTLEDVLLAYGVEHAGDIETMKRTDD